MIKVSILYPNRENLRFDFAYYLEKHMPLAVKLLGSSPGYRGVSVERGIGGGTPGTPPAFVAMCHFLFDSVDNFHAVFGAHAQVLQGDIPNYTEAVPEIQFSEVLLSQAV
jgi:uncharacterized protein (TIGR02118 family)